MHDGSVITFRSVPEGYDPTNRISVEEYIRDHQRLGEVVTGLLYLDESAPSMHEVNHTPVEGLNKLPFEALCPGSAVLEDLMADFR